MPNTRREADPRAFLGIGVSFMGAGVALAAALSDSSGPVVGISLFAVGVVFFVTGLARRRKPGSGGTRAGDDDRSPG